MWPSHAILYLVPCTAQHEYDEKITFWKNVCGLDFSPVMYVDSYYQHVVNLSNVVLQFINNSTPFQSTITFLMSKIAYLRHNPF